MLYVTYAPTLIGAFVFFKCYALYAHLPLLQMGVVETNFLITAEELFVRHSVGFFVLVRSLSCAYSYDNVTIIKRLLLKSVFIIGVVAAVFDHPPSKYQQTGVV